MTIVKIKILFREEESTFNFITNDDIEPVKTVLDCLDFRPEIKIIETEQVLQPEKCVIWFTKHSFMSKDGIIKEK